MTLPATARRSNRHATHDHRDRLPPQRHFAAPFDVVLFEDAGAVGSRKVAILFEEQGCCAVLDVSKLAAGDIAFMSNSWRGDRFEPHLRNAVTASRQSGT